MSTLLHDEISQLFFLLGWAETQNRPSSPSTHFKRSTNSLVWQKMKIYVHLGRESRGEWMDATDDEHCVINFLNSFSTPARMKIDSLMHALKQARMKRKVCVQWRKNAGTSCPLACMSLGEMIHVELNLIRVSLTFHDLNTLRRETGQRNREMMWGGRAKNRQMHTPSDRLEARKIKIYGRARSNSVKFLQRCCLSVRLPPSPGPSEQKKQKKLSRELGKRHQQQ